jgi:hypothetical protein
MEISPVSAIRIVSMVSSRETELGMPGVFGVEYSSRNGDETYTPKGSKAASGAEEEKDEYEEAESGEEEGAGEEPRIQAIEGGAKKEVNCFA